MQQFFSRGDLWAAPIAAATGHDGNDGARWIARAEAWISAGLMALATCLGMSAVNSYVIRFNLIEARADRMDYSLYLELTRMTGTERVFIIIAALLILGALGVAANAHHWNRKSRRAGA